MFKVDDVIKYVKLMNSIAADRVLQLGNNYIVKDVVNYGSDGFRLRISELDGQVAKLLPYDFKPERFEKVYDDPLSEIEDLNVRLSQKEFKVGDKVKFEDKYFIGVHSPVTQDKIYTVLGRDSFPTTITCFLITCDDGINRGFNTGWFKKVVDEDPLSEIEDLNVRTSERKYQFSINDRVKCINYGGNRNLTVGNIYMVVSLVPGIDLDHNLIGVIGDGGSKSEFYEDRFEKVDDDPLLEIEDLNVRLSGKKLSQVLRTQKESTKLSATDRGFKDGDKVVFVTNTMNYSYPADMVLNKTQYTIQEVHLSSVNIDEPGDAYGTSCPAYWTYFKEGGAGGSWVIGEMEKIEEDPLAEIEDLNVRMSQMTDRIYREVEQLSSNDRGYKKDDVVTVVHSAGHLGELKSPIRITDIYKIGNEYYLRIRDVIGKFESGWLIGRFEKIANEDPLAEIEDLNVRMSRNEFKVGDKVKYLHPIGVDGVVADGVLTLGEIYIVSGINGYRDQLNLKTINGEEFAYMGNAMVFYPRRFEKVNFEKVNEDPLSEIEDLNVRLSNQKFSIGDQITRKSWVADNNNDGSTFWVIDVRGDTGDEESGWIRIEQRNPGSDNHSSSWYSSDGFTKVDEDPLAEIEDLNVRLSHRNQDFAVGDVVKISPKFFKAVSWGDGKIVSSDRSYVIKDHRGEYDKDIHGNLIYTIIDNMGDPLDFSGMWFEPSIPVDPLAEIEDLNVRTGNKNQVFSVGDTVRCIEKGPRDSAPCKTGGIFKVIKVESPTDDFEREFLKGWIYLEGFGNEPFLGRRFEVISPEDPLAEIEDLNIVTAQKDFKKGERVILDEKRLREIFKVDYLSKFFNIYNIYIGKVYTVDISNQEFVSVKEVPESHTRDGGANYPMNWFLHYADEDPLAEIEDLNVVTGQTRLKVNDRVKLNIDVDDEHISTDSSVPIQIVRRWRNSNSLIVIDLSPGTDFYLIQDKNDPGEVNGHSDDDGTPCKGWYFYYTNIVPVELDPLAEIEDLNIKLSQHILIVGDKVKLNSRYVRYDELIDGSGGGDPLDPHMIYTVLHATSSRNAYGVSFISLEETGSGLCLYNSMGFDIVGDKDPLAEIEDLNIKLGQSERSFTEVKNLSLTDRGFKNNDKVIFIKNDSHFRYPDGMEWNKTVYTIRNLIPPRVGDVKAWWWFFLEENLLPYFVGMAEKVNDDPLAEIEDLNIKLSQQPKFKVGDNVIINNDVHGESEARNIGIHKELLDKWRVTEGLVISGFIEKYSNADIDEYEDVCYIVVRDPKDNYETNGEQYGWYFPVEAVSHAVNTTQEDPLAEIEDLNMRTSREKFNVNDRVRLSPDWFEGPSAVVPENRQKWLDDLGLDLKKVYTVAICNDDVCLALKEVPGSFYKHGGQHPDTGNYGASWFKKVIDEDPLSEIEDLNVRLSQRKNKFNIGDTVRNSHSTSDVGIVRWVGPLPNNGSGNKDEDAVWSEWQNHDSWNGELKAGFDGGLYYLNEDSLELVKSANIDPLSEIEDLNIRTSQAIVKCRIGEKLRSNLKCDKQDWDIHYSDQPFDHEKIYWEGVVSEIKVVGAEVRVWSDSWVHVTYGRVYNSGRGFMYQDDLETASEDPLSEIEDLNVVL